MIYNKKSVNDKILYENQIVHFKFDEDYDYKLGKIIIDNDIWKLVDLNDKKIINLDFAFEYYSLKIFVE